MISIYFRLNKKTSIDLWLNNTNSIVQGKYTVYIYNKNYTIFIGKKQEKRMEEMQCITGVKILTKLQTWQFLNKTRFFFAVIYSLHVLLQTSEYYIVVLSPWSGLPYSYILGYKLFLPYAHRKPSNSSRMIVLPILRITGFQSQ